MNVIAVDVGTTSVRLAVIAFRGPKYTQVQVLASREKEIKHRQDGVRFEQSSSEIWEAICDCSKACLLDSNLQAGKILGIAFSATCSLVVYSEEDKNTNHHDVIMWMDHRAIEEAQTITESKSKVLEQFGGICSPEFSLSKLVWLKKHAPERLNSASGLFELPDWLVYRCIGGKVQTCPQSLCCVTCKWGFNVDEHKFCEVVQSLELESKIGDHVLQPGTISGYVCDRAARDLGLLSKLDDKENVPNQGTRIVVGTSLIDAHSGMLAMLSTPLEENGFKLNVESTFCSLAGTSSCHMSLAKQKNFTRGIWGPYKNVVLDGYYLLEAGQSMTGKLIDMCIESHEESKKLLADGLSIRDIIGRLNQQIASSGQICQSELHVLPSYHGNRSPLANPRLMGGVYGLTAERQSGLLEHYIATVESIVYETKLIVETLGTKLDTVLVSGGLMKNTFYLQTLADVLECQVVKMALADVDLMVMGSGLVARQAVLNELNKTKFFNRNQSDEPLKESSLKDIEYSQLRIQVFKPRNQSMSYHAKKYSCYLQFVEFSQRVDSILREK